MEIIAEIHTDYPEKFGIPKQAGIVADSVGTIRFCGKYNVNEAVKGLENYDYIWILWQFDAPVSDNFTPTVRPPVRRIDGKRPGADGAGRRYARRHKNI